jgi:hypothetical protein
MPCYVMRKVSVKFQAKHINLLEKALSKLEMPFEMGADGKLVVFAQWGEQIVIDLELGQAKFARDLQDTVNQIKRAYSEQALIVVAKKKKWLLKSHQKETATTKTKKYAFVRY